MAFQKFKEYLNSKGKLDKVVVSSDGDTGPTSKKGDKPPKAATSGKNWKNFEAAQTKDGGNGADPVPYSAAGTDPGLETADGEAGKANPLGKKGDDRLIYNPKVQDQALRTGLKNKTEHFLDKTRKLTTEQYVDYILKQNPVPVKQILETASAIGNNKNLIESLVREIKRKGGFPQLLETILDQPETYKELAISLANGNKGIEVSRQIAKAINEITAPPAVDDIEEKSKPKNKKGKPEVPPVKLQPEHNLIEALSNYKSIKNVMKKFV